METLRTRARGMSEKDKSLKKWTHRLSRSPLSSSSERVTAFLVSVGQGAGRRIAGPRGFGRFLCGSHFCSSHLSHPLPNLGVGRKASSGPLLRMAKAERVN